MPKEVVKTSHNRAQLKHLCFKAVRSLG